MKKIIAAAVATAFIAPAMAADITISGSMTYLYTDTDLAGTGDTLSADDNQVAVTASTETSNGYSVTGKFTVVDDATGETDHQGTALTIAGPFGTVGLGDNGGALDATGDYTDMAATFGGFAMDGNDMALAYTLPTLVEGLTLRYSFSPDGNNYIAGGETTDVAGTANEQEASAYSATYSFDGIDVYYGREEVDRSATETTSNKAYGIRYTTGPLAVALEAGESDNVAAITNSDIVAGDDVEYRGVALSYKMGDTTLAFEKQEHQERDVADQMYRDETVISVHQNLGGGVGVFAAVSNDDSTDTNFTQERSRVGISFAF